MRSDDGMSQELGSGTWRTRWDRVALLALALQLRSAWLLLGPWVVTEGTAPSSLLGRIRMLPAHPDWYLPALVQSAVAALTLVGLARRWKPRWAVLAAAVASGVAWGVTFAWVPNGIRGYLLLVQPLQEILAMGIVLASVAMAWRRLGRWAAVPVVALVGGGGALAARLLLSYTVFRAPWPEGWPRDLANEAAGVALLAVGVAVLRRSVGGAETGELGTPGWRSGAVLGVAGLLALTVLHLVAGSVTSAWTLPDSRRLVVAAGLLAAVAGWLLVASVRLRRPRVR